MFIPRGQWSTFRVPIKGEQADREAQGMEDLMFDGRDKNIQLGQLGTDAPRAQVSVPRNRPVNTDRREKEKI